MREGNAGAETVKGVRMTRTRLVKRIFMPAIEGVAKYDDVRWRNEGQSARE